VRSVQTSTHNQRERILYHVDRNVGRFRQEVCAIA